MFSCAMERHTSGKRKEFMKNTVQPLVSVIIPLYNRREYIEECIDSIFAQTCQDFEILCIDDGLTDSGPEFCEEKYGDDARFHLVQQSNQGTWAARSHGLEQILSPLVFRK